MTLLLLFRSSEGAPPEPPVPPSDTGGTLGLRFKRRKRGIFLRADTELSLGQEREAEVYSYYKVYQGTETYDTFPINLAQMLPIGKSISPFKLFGLESLFIDNYNIKKQGQNDIIFKIDETLITKPLIRFITNQFNISRYLYKTLEIPLYNKMSEEDIVKMLMDLDETDEDNN